MPEPSLEVLSYAGTLLDGRAALLYWRQGTMLDAALALALLGCLPTWAVELPDYVRDERLVSDTTAG